MYKFSKTILSNGTFPFAVEPYHQKSLYYFLLPNSLQKGVWGKTNYSMQNINRATKIQHFQHCDMIVQNPNRLEFMSSSWGVVKLPTSSYICIRTRCNITCYCVNWNQIVSSVNIQFLIKPDCVIQIAIHIAAIYFKPTVSDDLFVASAVMFLWALLSMKEFKVEKATVQNKHQLFVVCQAANR